MNAKAKKKAHAKKRPVHVETSRNATGAVAVHAHAGHSHAVGIGDLRVMIVQEDKNVWFARGLEIDFAEQGTTQEDVQKRFEESLADTITEHLRMRGNIRALLREAPPATWAEYYDGVECERFRLTSVTAHRLLPASEKRKADGKRLTFFDNIAYHLPAEAHEQVAQS
jgi:hypothetical protein